MFPMVVGYPLAEMISSSTSRHIVIFFRHILIFFASHSDFNVASHSDLLKITQKQADNPNSRINEMLKLSFDLASQHHRSDDKKIKVY